MIARRWIWLGLAVAFIAFASYGSVPLMDAVYSRGVWSSDYALFHRWLNLHTWALHASVLFAVKSGWRGARPGRKMIVSAVTAALWADFFHRVTGVWWVDRSDWLLLIWLLAAIAAYLYNNRNIGIR